jgi:hypothetical protein|nr:MAG TPA: hypothetical protein [Caudoviricetes sp.]
MQMGLRNFLDYIQQYAANEYKRKTGNGMLGLYQQKVNIDRENMRRYYKNEPNTTTTPIYTTTTTARTPVRTYGYPTTNVENYAYTPANYITNFTQMPPISYHKWNNMF